jgi:hypothetical protein
MSFSHYSAVLEGSEAEKNRGGGVEKKAAASAQDPWG